MTSSYDPHFYGDLKKVQKETTKDIEDYWAKERAKAKHKKKSKPK